MVTKMSDLIDRQEVLKLFPKYDYKRACFDLCNAIKDMPSAQPKKVYIAEIKIDGDEMQKCVDKAVNRILYDAYQPLTEEDYAALRERFGAEVEKTVREMAEGNANRWMI